MGRRLLTEDRVSDYIKKQIANNSRYTKATLATPVAELPEEVRNNMQEGAPTIYNACVQHGQNLSAFLRLYFLHYFDISHGKGPVEYVMGLARIAIGELKMFDSNAESDTALLKQVVLFLHNSNDGQLKSQYDGNLNGLDFYTLVNQLNGARRAFNAANRARLKGAVGRTSNYRVVAINSAEEAAKYGQYTSWCVTHGASAYESYTEGGRRFYFCLRDGFESVPKEVGAGCPLDDYGLSMISVLVDPEGEPNVVTTRWNHENDGENNENLHTAEQLQEVTGIDFYATFKPYSLEQLTAMGITPFYAVQDMLDKGAEPEDVFEHVFEEKDGWRLVLLRNRYDFINKENKLMSDRWFDGAGSFSNGFAKVKLNDKWNLINSEGQILFKQWFDEVGFFVDGFAEIKLNGRWNFIDSGGKVLSDQWFEWTGTFSNGFARVELNKKYNYINEAGQLLSAQWFDFASGFLSNGFASVMLKNKYNCINKEGQLVSEWWFDNIGRFCNGFTQVKLDGKYNFINTEGQLLSEQWFDEVYDFNNGFAQVELNGKYNFINKEGQLLSEQWFDDLGGFNNGFAPVKLNWKWNFIDTKGRLLSKQWFDAMKGFYNGLAIVELNDEYNLINEEGQLLSQQWFDYIMDFRCGFARVKLNKKWNFIDDKGRLLSNQWFDNAWDFVDGSAEVEQDGRSYLIDTKGNLTLEESRRTASPVITESILHLTITECVRRILS